MGSEWAEKTWGELATLEYGKALKGYEQSSGKYRVYGTNGPIGWVDSYLYNKPSVIIGRKGAYRGVHFAEKPFFVIDTAFYLKPKTEFDMRWAYYQLLTQNINAMDSGSAIPSTSREDFYGLPLLFPSIDEQAAIAQLLSTLEQKITLNQQMNATLEAMAQALFKSWFVDFDPVKARAESRKPEGMDDAIAALFPSSFIESPLGPIPHGWEVSRLDKITKILGGFAFKSKDFGNSGNPVIKIKNINSNGSVNSLDVDFVSDEVASKVQKFLLDDGDLLMAMTGATVGKFGLLVNYLEKKCLLNQRVAKFIPNNQQKPWFIYTALSHEPVISHIINTALGSAQPNISTDGIGITKLVLPDSKVIHVFNSLIDSSFKKIIALRKEINYLSQLRDTLLPRLISGKLRVGEISETVEALAL